MELEPGVYTQFNVSLTVTPVVREWARGYWGSAQHKREAAEAGVNMDYWGPNYTGFDLILYKVPQGCHPSTVIKDNMQIDGFRNNPFAFSSPDSALCWNHGRGDVAAATHFIHRVLVHAESDEIIALHYVTRDTRYGQHRFSGGTTIISREGAKRRQNPSNWTNTEKIRIRHGRENA